MTDESENFCGYDPIKQLVTLRKVWPEAYGHLVWLLKLMLRVRWLLPREKHKGCSGELSDTVSATSNTILKEEKRDGICSG